MKSYKRYLSVLLCLPLLFAVFSVPVSAEAVTTETWKANILAYSWGSHNGTYNQKNFGQVDVGAGESVSEEGSFTNTFGSGGYVFYQQITFVDTTAAPLFKAGQSYTFTAYNFIWQCGVTLKNGSTHIFTDPRFHEAKLIYTDGTTELINQSSSIEKQSAYNTFSFTTTLTPSKDVYKLAIKVREDYEPVDLGISGTSQVADMFFGFGSGQPLVFDVDTPSKEEGLLGGILGKITDLWKTAEAGFANLVKGITELPQKIWEFIEDGLKNLFVPDDEYMASYSDRWDQLLESRLGAVYQVCDIVVNSWDGIMNADQTNTINLPLVSIPLGDSSFSFGGTDVKIVPDGFDGIVTTLKLIVGIVCTALFVNGLLKRYDEVMGVEK